MLEPLLNLLQESPLSLWGPFLLLLLCGVGFPLPEDLLLLAAGMLAQGDGRAWIPTAVLMYAGVIAGDTIIFFLGRRYGSRLLAWRGTQHLFPPQAQARVQRLYQRHGSIVIIIARFLPGLRMPVFSSAGAMRVSLVKFVIFDGVAALVSVPVFVCLGAWMWAKFGEDIHQLKIALSQTQRIGGWVGLAVAICVVAAWQIRQRARPRSAT